jgi:protein SCO1
MTGHEPVPPEARDETPASRSRPRRMATVAALLIAGMAVLWVGLTTERARQAGPKPVEAPAFRGGTLRPPLPKPPFTLTDMNGEPFDFVRETEGKLTLLFFGFTYCPDICPVHMANIAAVLRDLSPDVRRQISVIFVTGDPQRDTPERLKAWLGAFHPSFIGLHGSVDDVNAILADLRLPPLVHEEPDARGNYAVGHPAHILAFTPDGWLRFIYPFGIRQADWAHDLPRLVSYEFPAPDGESNVATLRAAMAYVPAPAADGPAALYTTIQNRGTEDDVLIGATAPVAGVIEVHRHTMRDGRMMMEQVSGAPVPAGDSLALEPGGYHLMLRELGSTLAVGDTFTVRLQFARGGILPVRAVVVPYAALQQMLSGEGTH